VWVWHETKAPSAVEERVRQVDFVSAFAKRHSGLGDEFRELVVLWTALAGAPERDFTLDNLALQSYKDVEKKRGYAAKVPLR
jgi:hypothetical protein